MSGHPSATVGIATGAGGAAAILANRRHELAELHADLDIPFRQNSFGLPTRSSAASRNHRRPIRLRHPQRHRGLLPHQRRPGRPPQQRAAGPEGDAVQRPAGVRLRHALAAVRDQRDPGRRRLRRRPAAGDRRALRRHVPDRAGRGLQRPALRAADAWCRSSARSATCDTFTFTGSETTSTSSSSSTTARRRCTTDETAAEDEDVIRTGTTVQLPTFSFVTVSHHGQRARRRHGAAGRHQAAERRPQRVRRAAPEQDALHQPAVQERGHRPRNARA